MHVETFDRFLVDVILWMPTLIVSGKQAKEQDRIDELIFLFATFSTVFDSIGNSLFLVLSLIITVYVVVSFAGVVVVDDEVVVVIVFVFVIVFVMRKSAIWEFPSSWHGGRKCYFS